MKSSFSFRVFCCAVGFGLLLAVGLVMKGKISIEVIKRAEIEE